MLDCGIIHTHKHFDAIPEIETWIEYLKTEKGFGQIIVSGHSRGGAQISAYLADRRDPAVKGGVMIAPAVYDARHQANNYQKRYGVKLVDLIETAQALNGDATMEVPGFLFCEKAKVTAESFLSYYTVDLRRDTPSNLTQVKSIPITVIAGSEDDVVELLSEKIANNAKNAQKSK